MPDESVSNRTVLHQSDSALTQDVLLKNNSKYSLNP